MGFGRPRDCGGAAGLGGRGRAETFSREAEGLEEGLGIPRVA